MEEIIKALLYTLLPSTLMLYGVYVTVKSFINKEMNTKLLAYKQSSQDITLPTRLQAYERMALFLERNHLIEILRRMDYGQSKAAELQQAIALNVREELAHNYAQQIYVSDKAWTMIISAVEESISIVNHCATELAPDAPARELAQRIFEQIVDKSTDQNREALKFLKAEIHEIL